MKNLLLTLMLFAFGWANAQCNLNISWTSSVNGGNITFTNTSTGVPTNPSFAWLYDGQSSSLENPTFPYDSTITDVCFAIYDINDPTCQDSICGPLMNDSTACMLNLSWTSNVNGGNITFTNTSTGVPSNPSFAWLYDGQSSSQENPTFTYNPQATQVCFSIYDINDPTCQDSICGPTNQDSTVCNLNISWVSSTSGGMITFYNTSTGTPSNASFAWLYDGQSSSLENPTFTHNPQATQVCFSIYDINDPTCQDSICGGLNQDSTATMTTEEMVEFNLFPNPTENELNVQLSTVDSDYEVAIYDMTGRKVYTDFIAGEYTVIDVSDLEKGGYIFYLIDPAEPEKLRVEKFLKR